MKENKVKIELEVYDELIEVYANKSDVNRYNDAAKLVTDRYNTYAELFREKKSQKTIQNVSKIKKFLQKCDKTYKKLLEKCERKD